MMLVSEDFTTRLNTTGVTSGAHSYSNKEESEDTKVAIRIRTSKKNKTRAL
jgi:hypothetical protein